MDDYISRESAINKLYKLHCKIDEDGYRWVLSRDVAHMIDGAPAADVVEVVRCIDCINWNGNDCVTMYGLFAPKPDDYCARGQQRVDDG